MQKKFIATYLIIFATLLAMMSLSRQTSDKIRGESVSIVAPFWEKILAAKAFFFHPFQPSPFSSLSQEEEKHHLQLENRLLETENSYLQKLLNEQLLLSSQISQVSSMNPEAARLLASDYQKSLQKNIRILERRLKAIPARVVFRSLDTWHNSLWINAGSSANENQESPIIALNSPVVIGNAVVGIIDYVGKNQSRVQLITDSRLTPSVRALRGGEQDLLLNEQIEGLMQQLTLKKHLNLSPDDYIDLSQLLYKLKESLHPFKRTWYLAKGELAGSLSASRTSQRAILKGTGFNYDFADEEGDSRDLRNGKPAQNPKEPALPILKVNDILVTTGMDGIFPPGFQVATVTNINLLKEGDYFYELEARPIAGPLEELSLVFVLPPLREEAK